MEQNWGAEFVQYAICPVQYMGRKLHRFCRPDPSVALHLNRVGSNPASSLSKNGDPMVR